MNPEKTKNPKKTIIKTLMKIMKMKKKTSQKKKQKTGNDPYMDYLDSTNFKVSPNKPKPPKFLPLDDKDHIVEKKPTISPVKVKPEKMEKEKEIADKEQEQRRPRKNALQIKLEIKLENISRCLWKNRCQ